MTENPCPKNTCPGTLRNLGTAHIAGVTSHYYECNTCRLYISEADPEHEEPRLL